MKNKLIIIVLLIAKGAACQNFIPTKDTIIEDAGIRIEYKVLKHAIFVTTYKDGEWNGPYKSYYKNGTLWSEGNRIDGKIDGVEKSYTPNGNIAVIDEWKNGVLKNKKIFYQNTIAEPQKYFFVSKEGFDLVKDGVQIKLENIAVPDSIIEENPYGAYIWINGRKKLFSGTEAPSYKLIKVGEKPGLYLIESDGKQTFIRALTKEEMK